MSQGLKRKKGEGMITQRLETARRCYTPTTGDKKRRRSWDTPEGARTNAEA